MDVVALLIYVCIVDDCFMFYGSMLFFLIRYGFWEEDWNLSWRYMYFTFRPNNQMALYTFIYLSSCLAICLMVADVKVMFLSISFVILYAGYMLLYRSIIATSNLLMLVTQIVLNSNELFLLVCLFFNNH